MKTIKFKKGTYSLNTEPNFNYQLNRTIMWSDGNVEDIKKISHKINSTETWVLELTKLGDKAMKVGAIENAIGYYRMAEFFDFDGSPEKLSLYNKSRTLFYEYNKEIFETIIKKEYISYENSEIPVWVAIPSDNPIDTIIIHGGNDSYIEEFLSVVLYLYNKNIAVYLFEGPGQGEALRKNKIPFTFEWEKPVKTVLDYYHISDATIIGISLGAMLAPRAAAFEKRIKRVIAWSIMPNFLDVLISTRKPILQKILKICLLLKFKGLINFLLNKQMKNDPMAKWGILHGMHNMGVNTPYEYLIKANKFQITNIADKIDQDFLLIGAQQDHFIPLKMYKIVIDSLTNIKSLTFRIFTKKENAENHCNAGNTEIVLKFIVNWIKTIKGI